MALVIAVGMLKDERDVVEAYVRHLLGVVDLVLVADNLSTDGTLEVLLELERQYPDRLLVRRDEEVAYYQGRKMTELAREAASFASHDRPWIVPVDADEVPLGLEHLRELREDVEAVALPGFDHLLPADDVDPAGHPFVRMAWRRSSSSSFRPKVAYRWHESASLAMGSHSVAFAGDRAEPTSVDGLEVRHFPVRSLEHLIRKARNGAAAYEATDLSRGTGAHWRTWGTMTDEELAGVLETYRADPAVDVLDPLPAGPWSR